MATTNSAKTVLQRSEYEPYGYLLNRPMEDGPGYTGHVTDAATGLVYMQQRYLDPLIGQRFLSVDPVTAYSPGGAFNQYWYANANPYGLVDPDGRDPRRSSANEVYLASGGDWGSGQTVSAGKNASSNSSQATQQPPGPPECDVECLLRYLQSHSANGVNMADVMLTLQGLLAPIAQGGFTKPAGLGLSRWQGATLKQLKFLRGLDKLGNRIGLIGLAMNGIDFAQEASTGDRFQMGSSAFGMGVGIGAFLGRGGKAFALGYGAGSLFVNTPAGDASITWLLDQHEAAVNSTVDTACHLTGC